MDPSQSPGTSEALLTEAAAKLVDVLTGQVLLPAFDRHIQTLEEVLPGLSEHVAAHLTKDMLALAFSRGVIGRLDALVDEGTPASLRLALTALEGLRSMVEGTSGPLYEAIRERLPGRFVGPDAGIFAGKNLGDPVAPPANIISLLDSHCDLSNDGRKVRDTHALVFIPATIDGEATKAEMFPRMSRAVTPSIRYIIEDPEIERGELLSRPIGKGTWVLEYLGGARLESAGSSYRVARLVEHLAVLSFLALEHKGPLLPLPALACFEEATGGNSVAASMRLNKAINLRTVQTSTTDKVWVRVFDVPAV